jgi:hypothetical protein
MKRSVLVTPLAMLLILSGCGNYLTASATIEIVGKKVADGVFGKVVIDPIWEFFFGNPNAKELEAVKNDFVKIATEKVLNALIPSAHADEIEFQCNAKEPQEECRDRAASLAEYKFNIYASGFVAKFRLCRDDIVLTPATGALDYTRQVQLITQCISDAGYRKEIEVILLHINRETQ